MEYARGGAVTDSVQIGENSLGLLDDFANTDVQKGLDRFAAVDAWIDSSLARLVKITETREAMARAEASAAVTVVAPLTNSVPASELTSLEDAAATVTTAATPEHVVFSNSLSQRSSRQKLQNESLIKSLQELRARMNDSKLKSGKVIPS